MKASGSRLIGAGTVIVCLSVFSVTGHAEIKQFAFQGTIIYVDNLSFVLDNSVTNGAPFEGFYVFDSAVRDSNTDPTVGDYYYTNGNFGVVVRIGNYIFRTDPRHVQFLVEVVNRAPLSPFGGGDHYLLRSYHNVCSKPIGVDHISWQLDDPTGRALSSDHLPATPPVLSAWRSDYGLSVIGPCDGTSFFIRGVIQAINETPITVPESPASAVGDAVEVKWQSQLGYYYQVQASERDEHWKDVGEPILGDGTMLSQFFPREHGKRTLYRVEVLSFP